MAAVGATAPAANGKREAWRRKERKSMVGVARRARGGTGARAQQCVGRTEYAAALAVSSELQIPTVDKLRRTEYRLHNAALRLKKSIVASKLGKP